MGQLDTFDEVPVGSGNLRFPLWIGTFWLEMTMIIEQREMEEGTGVDANDGAKSRNQEAEKLLERTLWGLRLWPLTGHN